MSYKRKKQMLDHLPWDEVAAKYASGWGFKRLADHYGENRSMMRTVLKKRGIIRPYSERTIIARAMLHAPARAKRAIKNEWMWRISELEDDRRMWNSLDKCWGQKTREERNQNALKRYYANHEENKRLSAKRAHSWYHKFAKLNPEQKQKRKNVTARWRAKNKTHLREWQRHWMANNPERLRNYRKKGNASAYNRMVHNMRKRLRDFIRAGRAYQVLRYHQMIGCTTKQLMEHIEAQFTDGMNWGNYGKWHIDHLRPCASFDLTDQLEAEQCFHYSNLRPLWSSDNLAKSSMMAGIIYRRGKPVREVMPQEF